MLPDLVITGTIFSAEAGPVTVTVLPEAVALKPLRVILAAMSVARVVVLVLDNLNTHTPAAFYATFPPDVAKRLSDKLEIHYTPKHGSWLNMAEIELSILSKQCLDRRIPKIEKLRRDVAAWEHERNQQQRKINWQFTTKDARIKLRSLYPSV